MPVCSVENKYSQLYGILIVMGRQAQVIHVLICSQHKEVETTHELESPEEQGNHLESNLMHGRDQQHFLHRR